MALPYCFSSPATTSETSDELRLVEPREVHAHLHHVVAGLGLDLGRVLGLLRPHVGDVVDLELDAAVSLVKRRPISASFLSEAGARVDPAEGERFSRRWPRAGGTRVAGCRQGRRCSSMTKRRRVTGSMDASFVGNGARTGRADGFSIGHRGGLHRQAGAVSGSGTERLRLPSCCSQRAGARVTRGVEGLCGLIPSPVKATPDTLAEPRRGPYCRPMTTSRTTAARTVSSRLDTLWDFDSRAHPRGTQSLYETAKKNQWNGSIDLDWEPAHRQGRPGAQHPPGLHGHRVLPWLTSEGRRKWRSACRPGGSRSSSTGAGALLVASQLGPTLCPSWTASSTRPPR